MTTVSSLNGEGSQTVSTRDGSIDVIVKDGRGCLGDESITYRIQVRPLLLLKLRHIVSHKVPPFRTAMRLFLPRLGIDTTTFYESLLNILVSQKLAALFQLAVLEFGKENVVCNTRFRHARDVPNRPKPPKLTALGSPLP